MKKSKKTTVVAPVEATRPPLPTIPLESELAPRQWAFVNHPLAWSDPMQAAKDVGYSESFCSKRAHGLKKELEFYIRPKVAAQMARLSAGPNHVLDELTGIATSNFMDYFNIVETEDGARVEVKQNLKALPVHMQKAIKRLDTELVILPDGGTFTIVSRIELYDKVAALKELAEVLTMKDHKDPDDPPELDNLEPQELEAMEKIFRGAADRAKAQSSKKRDQRAITVRPE